MLFEEPCKKWFKELKETRKKFKDVQNLIDSAKFKYERELNGPKWLIGIGLGVLFSFGIINLVPNSILSVISFWALIISLIELLVVVFIIIATDKRQKIAMAWLYKEKDEQNSKKKK